MTKTKFAYLCLVSMAICFPFQNLFSQIKDFGLQNDIQYGVSGKLQVILNDNQRFDKKSKTPTVRLCMNAGCGVQINLDDAHVKFLPAYHIELLLYHNGIGSSSDVVDNLDINNSLTGTLGITNASASINYNRVERLQHPLYFFSNHAPPPLYNPYNLSLTLGVNHINFTSKQKFSQRVGYFGLKIFNAQIGYYNDGGIGLDRIGDRKDRHYTGGLLLAYGLPYHTLLNHIELTYHKYTGYSRNTFELLGALSLGYNDYADTNQIDFNRSKWSLMVTGFQRQVSLNIDANNQTKLDLQHLIHKLIFDPYHIVLRKPTFSIGAGYQMIKQNYIR